MSLCGNVCLLAVDQFDEEEELHVPGPVALDYAQDLFKNPKKVTAYLIDEPSFEWVYKKSES